MSRAGLLSAVLYSCSKYMSEYCYPIYHRSIASSAQCTGCQNCSAIRCTLVLYSHMLSLQDEHSCSGNHYSIKWFYCLLCPVYFQNVPAILGSTVYPPLLGLQEKENCLLSTIPWFCILLCSVYRMN